MPRDPGGLCRTALSLGFAWLALNITGAAAQDAPAPGVDGWQSAYRGSIGQESVRKGADKIQGDLVKLMTEINLNALETPELAILSRASTHLSGLTRQEMQQVINALQGATLAADESKRDDSLVTAYRGQLNLVLKLKELAVELTVPQAGDKLIHQLEELIVRQSANIRHTSALQANGHAPNQFDARENSLHDMTGADQASIGGEIDLLFKNLAAETEQAPPEESSELAKTVLDAMRATALKKSAPQATALTQGGPLPEAITRQTSVRDDLTAVLRAAVAKTDALTQLRLAKAQLEEVQADQRVLTGATRQPKLDGATLAEHQAEVKDRTDVTSVLVQPLNPQATSKVNNARQDMAQSFDALTGANNPADDAPKQEEASQSLATAAKLLDQQIASVGKQQGRSAADRMAQMQKAQDEIRQARQSEQASPQTAAKDLQQAQKDAADESPSAAAQLADAAAQLQQSPSNTDAANQNMTQASQELQAQAQALAQTVQAAQAMAKAGDQLEQAWKLATTADQNLKAGMGKDLSDPAGKLGAAQDLVAQIGQGLPGDLPGDAGEALKRAAEAFGKGSGEAGQSHRGEAETQAEKGLAALQQAQDAVAQALAQMPGSCTNPGHGLGKGERSPARNCLNPNRDDGSNPNPGQQQVLPGFGPDNPGSALVMGGLSPKDRDAITQYQAEKTPPEYDSLVQQYLKNLADTP